jgi:hypothetical protein
MPRSLGKLVALLVVAALCGCTAAGATPAPDPTVTVVSSPTPTGTPVAAWDPADPTTWVISAEGVGPLRLGDDIAEAVAAIPAFPEPDDAAANCGNPAITLLGPPGASTADGGILLAAAETGEIVAVAVSIPGPLTAEGVGVGSTLGDVRAAYPTAVESLRYGSTPQLTVQSDSGWITFQSTDGMGQDAAPVDLVSVIVGGTPPNEYCG